MTQLDIRHPEFAVGIRGYDRAQVDDYISFLQGLVEDAEERAHEAEAEPVFDEYAEIGPRVAEIFRLTEVEARELKDQVKHEATELLDHAREEADHLVEETMQTVTEMEERARAEHEAMLEELTRERDRIRAETVWLARQKAEAIGELRRLHGLIEQAVEAVAAPGAIIAPALEDSEVYSEGETVELPAPAPGEADTA